LPPLRHIRSCCTHFSSSFHAPAPTDIYTLSLHDALPILVNFVGIAGAAQHYPLRVSRGPAHVQPRAGQPAVLRSLKPNADTERLDRKSTRLNSSHVEISYAVFCLKKKKKHKGRQYVTRMQ